MRTQSPRFASDRCRARKVRSAGHDKADRTLADRFLRQVVENKVVGLDGLQTARLVLVKVFGRIERLQQKIDEAFCGAPFLLNLPPDSPANRRRFNTYFNEHRKATQLIGYALELWSFACGLKREDDWTPVLVADINRKAFQEVWRQDPNQNAAVSVRSAPGDGAQAPTGKTDRAPVTQIDIGGSDNSPANKNRAAKRRDAGALASPK